MFRLEFTTDNAAFDDGGATETARILTEIAKLYLNGKFDGNISDLNGNTIGKWETTK